MGFSGKISIEKGAEKAFFPTYPPSRHGGDGKVSFRGQKKPSNDNGLVLCLTVSPLDGVRMGGKLCDKELIMFFQCCRLPPPSHSHSRFSVVNVDLFIKLLRGCWCLDKHAVDSSPTMSCAREQKTAKNQNDEMFLDGFSSTKGKFPFHSSAFNPLSVRRWVAFLITCHSRGGGRKPSRY